MSERMNLQKLYNTRDLGGIVTADGRRIKKNRLIRSGQLYAASKEDLEMLQKYGVNQIIDLRTPQEMEEKPDPVMEGVRPIHLPILTDLTQGVTREEEADRQIVSQEEMFAGLGDNPDIMTQYMISVYTQFVTDEYAIAQYARFLDLVLKNESGATLWHCAGGKDRAGFAAVLLLECLGVSHEVIMEDYLFTNECLQTESAQMFQDLKEQYHISTPEDEVKLKNVVKTIHAAREEYLSGIYQIVEERYGNFRNFLHQALGMDEEKIAGMRKMYLEN